MLEIAEDRLDKALLALGDLLELGRFSAHLVVIGGGGLIAIGAVSRPTQDVDVVALERNGSLVSAEPLPDPVREAATTVARDLGLKADWLNSGPTSLLIHGLLEGFRERLTTREYGPALRVSFAARRDQIFLKLYAWASRQEQRDVEDLGKLAPTDQELRDAARWARTHNMPGPFDDEMRVALEKLGVEDEGRSA